MISPGCAVSQPVFTIVCANDALRPAASVVAEIACLGAHGVLNAPTLGLLTGRARGCRAGFQREVDLMTCACAHGLRAWGYACNAAQAEALPAIRCGFFGASVFEHASSISQAVRAWRTALAPAVPGREQHP